MSRKGIACVVVLAGTAVIASLWFFAETRRMSQARYLAELREGRSVQIDIDSGHVVVEAKEIDGETLRDAKVVWLDNAGVEKTFIADTLMIQISPHGAVSFEGRVFAGGGWELHCGPRKTFLDRFLDRLKAISR